MSRYPETMNVRVHATIETLTFAEYVGRRIRHARTSQGLTQDQVVSQCQISKAFLNECENGKRSISLRKIMELARVLDRDIDWFVQGWKWK